MSNGNGKDSHLAQMRAFLQRPEARFPGLAGRLSARHWLTRELPAPERLLGDLVTNSSRVFIVGSTGVGKTMIGFGVAVGMASGLGYLHWRSPRALRVLYIDGEMACDLVQQRLKAEIYRAHAEQGEDNLMIYSNDDAEALGASFHGLGLLQALNLLEGQMFLQRLCIECEPDVVIFDNVQSLVIGALRDEETWIPVLDLVRWLTSQRIAQIWIDHTGWNTERQYGSSTKSWQFDTVGIMTPLPEELRRAEELGFTLSFEAPGKARRRTPENWREFAPHIIRLDQGRWTSEAADGKPVESAEKKLPPSRVPFFGASQNAVVAAPGARPYQTTLAAWQSECVRMGLLDPAKADDRRDWLKDFRRAKSELVRAGWISIDGQIVTLLRHK